MLQIHNNMDYQRRETTPLAWTSLAFGLIGVVLIVALRIASSVPALARFLDSLGIRIWLAIGFFFVVGSLALLFGLAAIVAITGNRRGGWIPAIAGILLGAVDIFIGLIGMALARLQ
jgi:hypothetical protein